MTRLELSHRVLPTAESRTGATWRYATTAPGENWMHPDFDDSDWKTGAAGFGRGIGQVTTRTRWRDDDIYLRTVVDIPADGITSAHLRFFHDDDCEIYVNGRQVLARMGYTVDYEDITLAHEQAAAFVPGKNVIAAHCRNDRGPQVFDVGITVEPATAPLAPSSALESSDGKTPENAHNPAASSEGMAKEKEPQLQTTSDG